LAHSWLRWTAAVPGHFKHASSFSKLNSLTPASHTTMRRRRHAHRVGCSPTLTPLQRQFRCTALPVFWQRLQNFSASLAACTSEEEHHADPAAPSTASCMALHWLAPALAAGLRELCEALEAALQRRADLAAALGQRLCTADGEALARSLCATLSLVQPQLLGDALTAVLAKHLLTFAAGAGLPLVSTDEDEDEDEHEHEAQAAVQAALNALAAEDSEVDQEGEEGELAHSYPSDMEGVEGGAAAAPLSFLVASLEPLGLAALSEECVGRACDAALRAHLLRRAGGSFAWPLLVPAKRWLAAVPLRFAAAALAGSGRERALAALRSRLSYALHAGLGALRSDKLFDIIVDFPDSAPALADLRACLRRTRLAPALGRDFRAALRRRLLHAGAATPDILAQYMGCIRALRLLDPSGALLEAVSPPIRAYLYPGRRDAIRCIVQLLTEDADGEGVSLMEEPGDAAPPPADETDLEADAPPPPGDGWARWRPPRVHHEPGGCAPPAACAPRGDVVAQLVSIFGSRELFVAEYRALLAERLLARAGYDCEREVRTLELLKLRFGEAPLHGAEVMLKDLADSRRVDANCRAPAGLPLGATIVSHYFWPAVGSDAAAEVALPPPVEEAMACYAASYEALKAPRKLLWRRNAGAVTLQLALGGERRAFSVSALQAALVWRFSERDSWRLEELATALKLPVAVAQAATSFWVKQGVLREAHGGDGALLLVTADAFAAAGGAVTYDEPTPADAQAGESDAAEVVYEQYLLGMLTNFDSLSAERIHNMLKMFVADPPYEKTAAETESALLSCMPTLFSRLTRPAVFLARMTAEEKIALVDPAARIFSKFR